MRNQRRKLGVKYCGGCSSKYDRVALLERIQAAVSDSLEFVSWEDETVENVLVIAGCETVCVDPAPFKGKAVHWVNSDGDVPELIEHLRLWLEV